MSVRVYPQVYEGVGMCTIEYNDNHIHIHASAVTKLNRVCASSNARKLKMERLFA